MQRITILGATGSIGVNTLDVIARHPQRFEVFALAANRDGERLFEQCRRFQPRYAVLADAQAAATLRERIGELAGCPTQVLGGAQALIEVAGASEVDCVVAGIVGSAGLLPTLAAARGGKRILLANKEALVMAGALFLAEVKRNGATLIPVDSEHNAVYQCLPAQFGQRPLTELGVRRILLTASGGPFRCRPLAELRSVTPAQACAHPNWVMGRKISVDSATLMNKGLELIEACLLFDVEADRVEAVIHPQSIVHALVEYVDGSLLAQLGNPDMRTPLAHALATPGRIVSGTRALDLLSAHRLEFEAPDHQRFPCLNLAYKAMQAGGTAPAILNAANEVAVGAFLRERLRFTDISVVIEHTLEAVTAGVAADLDQLLAVDRNARRVAERAVAERAGGR
ncbi:MAG: 1-deoxy-D-xylulose-5-phosphate reductoisomerase [Nitrococcus sp.]|nr:1-deoxy-D-xylulose-5-phosphate reductoisomerase [Nitrococcus sp.]